MNRLQEPQPVTAACACDNLDRMARLISVEHAQQLINAQTSPISDCEMVPLSAAVGRTLAQNVRAQAASPAFNNSAMDGYAVNAASLIGDGPWQLKVSQRIAAGDGGVGSLADGAAARIFTGAPVPKGATAVIAQEDVRRDGNTIGVSTAPAAGCNIRRAGEEFLGGAKVLGLGTQLQPRHIACCAAAGCSNVRVRRRIRVALVASGSELRPAGHGRNDAEVWDVNSPMLAAELAQSNVELTHIEAGPDNPNDLIEQFARLSNSVDLLITTGGVSVGEEDHVKSVVRALEGTILFSGVALKPGKPVSCGRIGPTVWLGLPGNPLSAFVTWHLFGKPLLAKLGGLATVKAPTRQALSNVGVQRRPGRCEYRPATVIGRRDGMDLVEFEQAVHSNRITSLAHATGLVRLPEALDVLRIGASVEYIPFK